LINKKEENLTRIFQLLREFLLLLGKVIYLGVRKEPFGNCTESTNTRTLVLSNW